MQEREDVAPPSGGPREVEVRGRRDTCGELGLAEYSLNLGVSICGMLNKGHRNLIQTLDEEQQRGTSVSKEKEIEMGESSVRLPGGRAVDDFRQVQYM